MLQVWTSVKVKTPDHPRAGEAGVIFGQGQDADHVIVRFDLDLADVEVALADLQVL